LSLLEAFGDGFARRALVEAVMVGGLCGAVGVHVLLRRLPFFTMALGHATFPGVVLAGLLGSACSPGRPPSGPWWWSWSPSGARTGSTTPAPSG
jgi:ABC-type Mn2+/Zn2+ transport system permease subunit